jgi:endo-1,4-beta-mannosidase
MKAHMELSTAHVLQNWVKQMAAYVKSLDPNHMVGVGEEGFYSTTPTRLSNNPGADTSPWAAAEGQDFIADHSSPDIDYAAFHSWIDRLDGPLMKNYGHLYMISRALGSHLGCQSLHCENSGGLVCPCTN